MTLAIIGLGLHDPQDITVKGLELVRQADFIYLENYTSLLQCSVKDLEEFYKKSIIVANRDQSEQGMQEIIDQAKTKKVAFLVIGDPFSATTHIEIYKLAQQQNIETTIVHNASILTAIGQTGLQLYKFGKTTSIPFLDDFPQLETPYHAIKDNLILGYHTLCLLDIQEDKKRYMTISQAIDVLQDIEKRLNLNIITNNMKLIGCARIGAQNQVIKYATIQDLQNTDFGPSPQT